MKVRLTPQADAQFSSLFDYIAADSPAAAEGVRSRIERALELLGDYPSAGRPGRIGGTRVFAVPKTPYVVIYRVGDAIDVLAILHGRQNR